jgi:hypothetical protein
MAASQQDVTVDQLWGRVLEGVGPVHKASLQQFARPISFLKEVFTVEVDAEHFELINNSPVQKVLQTKLKEFGHSQAEVKFIRIESAMSVEVPLRPTPLMATARSEPVAKTPEKLNPSDFANDPLIRRAMEMFKAQIVDVRA